MVNPECWLKMKDYYCNLNKPNLKIQVVLLHNKIKYSFYVCLFKNKLETLSEELKKRTEFVEELQSMVCMFHFLSSYHLYKSWRYNIKPVHKMTVSRVRQSSSGRLFSTELRAQRCGQGGYSELHFRISELQMCSL